MSAFPCVRRRRSHTPRAGELRWIWGAACSVPPAWRLARTARSRRPAPPAERPADLNGLGTVGWDIARFGIQFVASPRHADGLVITGPVSQSMELALRKTWEAMPEPKIVIAVGACAISGGPFAGNPEVMNGAEAVVPVDLFIPGWPPHPLTILDGLLRLLGRVEGTRFPAQDHEPRN